MPPYPPQQTRRTTAGRRPAQERVLWFLGASEGLKNAQWSLGTLGFLRCLKDVNSMRVALAQGLGAVSFISSF